MRLASVPCRRSLDNSDLRITSRSLVILAHCRFVRSEFLLDASAVISGGTIEIALRVGQLICVQSKLCLRNVKIVAVVRVRRRRLFLARLSRRRIQLSRQTIYLSLILRDQPLQPLDLLREGKRLALSVTCSALRRAWRSADANAWSTS